MVGAIHVTGHCLFQSDRKDSRPTSADYNLQIRFHHVKYQKVVMIAEMDFMIPRQELLMITVISFYEMQMMMSMTGE
eukprot:gene16286-17925_t